MRKWRADEYPLICYAVGHTLRNLRLDRGWSQRELARRIGSHREIVGRVERGVHSIRVETAERHARACGGTLLEVLAAVDAALFELGLSECPAVARRPFREWLHCTDVEDA